jgi:hypothetical protein
MVASWCHKYFGSTSKATALDGEEPMEDAGSTHLIDAHEGSHMGGAQQGQQVVLGHKVEGVGLLQAQQDGQGQVEAPLQLVQVRGRLQQRLAVSARAPGPGNTHQQRAVKLHLCLGESAGSRNIILDMAAGELMGKVVTASLQGSCMGAAN